MSAIADDIPRWKPIPWGLIGTTILAMGFLVLRSAGGGSEPPPADACPDGNEINAASASRTDVNTAISGSSPGDCIIVPADSSESWSGGVTFSGRSLICPGKDSGSPTNITAGKVTMTKHATEYTRLQGCRFTGTDAHLTVGGNSSDAMFAVLDNYFNIAEVDHGITIAVNGGVIADNDFDGPFDLLNIGGNSIASTLGATAASNSEWAAAPTFGVLDTNGTANVYIEDNVITNLRDGWDCDDGAKMAVRHNTFNDASVITHGGGSGGSGNDTSTYGCRQLEVYNNTFNRVNGGPTGSGGGPVNRWVWFRGSSGVIANNVMDEANTQEWGSGEQVQLSVGCSGGSYPRQYQTGQGTQSPDATPNYPIEIFGNTGYGVPGGEILVAENPNNACATPGSFIQSGRDYTTSNTWWSAYEYPHPLRAHF